ncbi:helix-turn-helix transcriptional regulator [Pedobacter caeni]|uniref:Transcriptional regulator, AraC family n=1 Tax=Pedobacter caeni TaxID=288992 RepID=A0A1M5BJX0_9SPHI|nr:AraC family transcriptional regulator [Pedobacter caeni]SHF42748.1 transcriptional regulator, AraC family [Pedobacter caeni]
MKSIFKSSTFAERCHIVKYPDGFNAEGGIEETGRSVDCACFKERVRSTFLQGIHIEERHVELKEAYQIDVQHDFPFLKMQFELEGYSLFESGIGAIPDVEICGNHHQLFYLPEVKGRLSYHRNRSTLEIKLTFDFLNRVFSGNLDVLLHFGKAISNNSAQLLSSKPMPINMQMRNLIQDIRNCPYQGLMKKVLLECKVTELLLMQLSQCTGEEEKRASLNPSDIDKLYYVKELIAENLHQPKTILQLSQIAGINDFKLKKEFKRLFGDTLFGHLTKVRLDHARGLILSGSTVSEASIAAGYRHQQHFTNAFKRHYGYLPSQIRHGDY